MDITATQHTGYLSTISRIRTILFAILFACMGNGLLSYLVPIMLKNNGIDQTRIGIALSAYSFGFFLGCFFSSKVVSRVGHIRSYCIVASIIAISALLHSFSNHFIFTALLRFAAGFAVANVYITLESWLNGASSSQSRGTILGVYQTAVALGFSASPWLLNLLSAGDTRMYSLVAIMLAISLIPLTISRRPAPAIPDSSSLYPLHRLFLDSPAAVIGSLGAGLIALPLTQLMVLFLTDQGYSGFTLSLILSCAFLGSFLFQMPVGKMADRFDKRKVYLTLLLLLTTASGFIIVNTLHPSPQWSIWILVGSYLIAVGCCNCLQPLSVTLLFDQIDTKDAVNATASMTVVHSVGLILGPFIAGLVMEQFGNIMLFVYTISFSVALILFLIIRIYMQKITIQQEGLPYFMSIQSFRPSNINLNPSVDYQITNLDDPAFTNLVSTLAHAEPSQYTKILEESLFASGLSPENIVLNLVISLPRESDTILKAMLSLHPETRQKLAVALHDVIGLDKKRINALLLKGLSYKASRKERAGLKRYFEQSIQEENQRNSE